MVYLGGPRRRRGGGAEPLRLHDPPPGYRPEPVPPEDLARRERQTRVLVRVTSVILVVLAVATLLFITAVIASH